MDQGKSRSIVYWATTGIVSFEVLVGGLSSLAQRPAVVAGLAHLGYPAYFGLILGSWKLLGVVAVLAPRLPRLKEWAYAGIFFDLTSAALSHAICGDGAKALIPLAVAVIATISWASRPSSRVVGALPALPGRSRLSPALATS
jgi:hypothetical protein